MSLRPHAKYFKEHLITFGQKYNPILILSVNLPNPLGSPSSWDLQALAILSLEGGKAGYFGEVLFPPVCCMFEIATFVNKTRNALNAAQPAVMQTRWQFLLQCCHYFINFCSDFKRMWMYPKTTITANREVTF